METNGFTQPYTQLKNPRTKSLKIYSNLKSRMAWRILFLYLDTRNVVSSGVEEAAGSASVLWGAHGVVVVLTNEDDCKVGIGDQIQIQVEFKNSAHWTCQSFFEVSNS